MCELAGHHLSASRQTTNERLRTRQQYQSIDTYWTSLLPMEASVEQSLQTEHLRSTVVAYLQQYPYPLLMQHARPHRDRVPYRSRRLHHAYFFGSIPYLSTDCLFFTFSLLPSAFLLKIKSMAIKATLTATSSPHYRQYQQASKAQKNKVHNQNSVTYISIACYPPPHRQNTTRLKHRSINLNNNTTRLVHLARPTASNFIEIYSR